MRVKEFHSARQACQVASGELVDALSGHRNTRCLLLVSGGSSAEVACQAASQLDDNITHSITLAQIDERYGPPGHPHSNWQHLLAKGIDPNVFARSAAMLEPGCSASELADQYNQWLAAQLSTTDYSIGLLGLGVDGHIAGMLPMASVQFIDLFMTERLVSTYSAADFERITVTATALMRLDRIVVFVAGKDKAAAVAGLHKPQRIHEFPAEILQRCRDVVVCYGKET